MHVIVVSYHVKFIIPQAGVSLIDNNMLKMDLWLAQVRLIDVYPFHIIDLFCRLMPRQDCMSMTHNVGHCTTNGFMLL